MEFEEFPKIARLSRDCVITEKIDGTNASIVIEHAELIADWSAGATTPWLKKVGDFGIAAGSRTRYITPHSDNHGWANWVFANADELIALGPGRHFGEWWGSGIQRGYGLEKGQKRFSLFNVARWGNERDAVKYPLARPSCCDVVPTLWTGQFNTEAAGTALERLKTLGSVAAHGFMNPEGVVIYHQAGNIYFKKTIEKDDEPKGKR